jgi:hypothetical protein
MSGTVLPASTNPPATPSTFQRVEAVALDTLKLAVNFAATPTGMAAITAILGPASPAVNLIVQFGVRALSGILPDLTTTTVTDADIEAALKAKGVKVEPFDPTTMFLKVGG